MGITEIFENELAADVTPKSLAIKYVDEVRKFRSRGHTFKAIYNVVMKIEEYPDIGYESWHRATKKELSRTHRQPRPMVDSAAVLEKNDKTQKLDHKEIAEPGGQTRPAIGNGAPKLSTAHPMTDR